MFFAALSGLGFQLTDWAGRGRGWVLVQVPQTVAVVTELIQIFLSNFLHQLDALKIISSIFSGGFLNNFPVGLESGYEELAYAVMLELEL